MATATVYYNGILLGAGSVAAGASQITGWTAHNPGLGNDIARRCGHNRRVHVVTSGFASSNGVYRSRVVKDTTILAAADNEKSTVLTMAKPCPFS